jgi:hypothetical protein
MDSIPESTSPRLAAKEQVRCREIVPSDLGSIITILNDGFRPSRGRDFWAHVLACLAEHPVPAGYPRYGYLLESDHIPVGVILMIFSAVPCGETVVVRCNVSSWCVQPAFRMYAPLLISRALRDKHVTYLNVTAAPHTLSILEAQGYRQYSSGRCIALPALSRGQAGSRVEIVCADTQPGDGLEASDVTLLLTHTRYGCISVICTLAGVRYPFIFARRRKYGVLSFAFLVFCRNMESFVQCAGPLGRSLAWRGIPLVIVDANGPMPGLIGLYRDRNPKYFKGPHQPSLGDLAYTERAMFGV